MHLYDISLHEGLYRVIQAHCLVCKLFGGV